MSGSSLLAINNIEVVYNQTISAELRLTLDVPAGKVISLLGANGAGKTTTLKACSNLLHAERGMVTKGSVELDGKDIVDMPPNELVDAGMVQVLEGRHCFTHLSVEENLLTGSFIRKTASGADIKRDLEMVYDYFPRIRDRRKSATGLISGGEQQMTAIGRALMARPRLILLDEPSMGLAPQFVEEVFNIISKLNKQENVSFLVAEQNAMISLRYADYGYIMENGRVMLKGEAKSMLNNDSVRELYLGAAGEDVGNFRNVKYYHRRRPVFY